MPAAKSRPTVGSAVKLFLLGLFFLGFSAYDYVRFTAFEQHGGTMTVSSLDKMLYGIGGKWGVVLVTLVFGLGCVIAAIRAFILSRRPAPQAQ